MAFASRSASRLALRQLGSGPAVASSSRTVVAAFSSTASSSYAASTPEDATSRKAPYSAAAEASPAPSELNAIGRGRKSAGRGRPKMLAPYDQWILSDARVYKQPKPGMGPNWIGDTPFPLNPSFNPPAPIRQSTKTEIWRLHASDPKEWTIRALSEKFSIGLQRTEAILRLKALENEWTSQDKPLQSEFQSNMDRLLGAQDRKRGPEFEPSVQSNDKSVRGIQHEEFSEAEPLDAPSVIAPALAEETLKRSSMIAALPSGGPDVDAMGSSRVVENKRAPLSITSVSGESYKGAGRVQRNERQADKRKGAVAKKQAAADAAAEAVAEAARVERERRRKEQRKGVQAKKPTKKRPQANMSARKGQQVNKSTRKGPQAKKLP
ncbi:Ribosomal protein S35, mitochondrial [Kalmanozyma brasiliensis GHG001]|uniref:Uncharacterized protein n=1 Tax=Kalmanozyma brasiliensis (strain GHG001) TaxID=1365824 RepID=V5E4Z5_KALBG|nr:Ribosomal protein S35, mitochondrial [Kalmanozyma brasiliensis GHG001]EST05286.1 Ribosomal protein S35, mitochondrial [Kalmanozyma brasiliensis GHG001]